MVEQLAEVPELPRDTPLLILTGFTKCIVPVTEFVGPFELMLNNDRVIQLETDGDRHDNRKFLERVKKLTILVSNSFQSLNFSNQWKIPYNHQHGMAKENSSRDNCGGEQYTPDFPHPCDKSKTKNTKE